MLQIAPIFDNIYHVIVFLSVLSSIDFFVSLLNGIKSHDLVRHLLSTKTVQVDVDSLSDWGSEKIAVSRPFVFNEFFWVEFLSY